MPLSPKTMRTALVTLPPRTVWEWREEELEALDMEPKTCLCFAVSSAEVDPAHMATFPRAQSMVIDVNMSRTGDAL